MIIALGFHASMEDTGHIARQTFLWMRKNKISANPVNYAIAYCYIDKGSEQLSNIINEKLNAGKAISSVLLLELYNRYLSELQVQHLKQSYDDLFSILSAIGETIHHGNTNFETYDKTLENCIDQLINDKKDNNKIEDVINL